MITVFSPIFQKNMQVAVTDNNPLRVLVNQKSMSSTELESQAKKVSDCTPRLAQPPTMPVAQVTAVATTTVTVQKSTCNCSYTC